VPRVGLKAATASPKGATVPVFVRSRPYALDDLAQLGPIGFDDDVAHLYPR